MLYCHEFKFTTNMQLIIHLSTFFLIKEKIVHKLSVCYGLKVNLICLSYTYNLNIKKLAGTIVNAIMTSPLVSS